MIVWLDGAHDPSENMRRDRALLAARARPAREPVLRLFGFEPPGITLGAQPGTRARARSRALPARRRAHGRCARPAVAPSSTPRSGPMPLAAPIADPEWGGNAGARLRPDERARRAFAACGSACRPSSARPARRGDPAPPKPCFASTARHEIDARRARSWWAAPSAAPRARCCSRAVVLLGEGHLRLADYVRAAIRRSVRAALRPPRRERRDVARSGTCASAAGRTRSSRSCPPTPVAWRARAARFC